jgi:hypothetical protein
MNFLPRIEQRIGGDEFEYFDKHDDHTYKVANANDDHQKKSYLLESGKAIAATFSSTRPTPKEKAFVNNGEEEGYSHILMPRE